MYWRMDLRQARQKTATQMRRKRLRREEQKARMYECDQPWKPTGMKGKEGDREIKKKIKSPRERITYHLVPLLPDPDRYRSTAT
jgi:hypothetical protein